MSSFKHLQKFRQRKNAVIRYITHYCATEKLVQVSSKKYVFQKSNRSNIQGLLRQKIAIPIFQYLHVKLGKRGISPKVKVRFYDVIEGQPFGQAEVGTSYVKFIGYFAKLLLPSWVQQEKGQVLMYNMEVAKVDPKHLVFDYSPPVAVKGMKELDRNAFRKDVHIAGIVIPQKNMQKVAKLLRHYHVQGRQIGKFFDLKEENPLSLTHKIMLFDPSKVKKIDDLPDSLKEEMKELTIDLETFCFYNIELQYKNWNYDEVLEAILPDSISEKVGGFALVGHIAHLNLKEDLLPYKNLIGEVIIDKVPQVTTVVNKVGTIDNTYRNFQMEIIAGEDETMTSVKENGCTFTFDYSKVYWNSKLGTEHQRIVDRISPDDIVYDVFAGVGPFAIPAAKKGAHVYANDLNPDSYYSLVDNSKANKIKKGSILCFNLDGRDFIKTIVKEDILKRWKDSKKINKDAKLHIVMNLPAIGIEFLDAFLRLFKGEKISSLPKEWYPHVHCYCFSSEEDYKKDVESRIEGVLKEPVPKDFAVRRIRNVAPNKEMLCVTFQLSPDLLIGEAAKDEGPTEKKIKLDEES
ncbi:hypothetical protein FSP39_016977 [Pinctada imbricata]|uniref:tRNA (guanine(37)-N1)-methyltransferase n=1 Tax=Pinctada imbricata TaxID=66713 RepID=A0AA89C3P5_PINIB|nr:hypothetical protein FSP39_016977 [Pinctada imbricata]